MQLLTDTFSRVTMLVLDKTCWNKPEVIKLKVCPISELTAGVWNIKDCGGLSVLQQDTSERARPFFFSLDEAVREDDGMESHPQPSVETGCVYILVCDLNGPGKTLVGSRYPPPSLPQTLADTHRRAVIFHPARWTSDRSGRGSASMEGRLAGLTPPYSPVNYGHLLGRPSLGAFQGPWLLP